MDPKANQSQPPHGIMGLQDAAIPWGLYAIIAVTLGLFLLLIWRLWLWWRARQAKLAAGAQSAAIPEIEPWTRIQMSYAALQVGVDWSRETSEAFFSDLTLLLRQAMELQTGLLLTSQTLAEVSQTLSAKPVFSPNFKQELLEFLTVAEQLKFSGGWLDTSGAQTWRTQVGVWLDQLQRGEL